MSIMQRNLDELHEDVLKMHLESCKMFLKELGIDEVTTGRALVLGTDVKPPKTIAGKERVDDVVLRRPVEASEALLDLYSGDQKDSGRMRSSLDEKLYIDMRISSESGATINAIGNYDKKEALRIVTLAKKHKIKVGYSVNHTVDHLNYENCGDCRRKACVSFGSNILKCKHYPIGE